MFSTGLLNFFWAGGLDETNLSVLRLIQVVFQAFLSPAYATDSS